jgi:hypothetical protein
VEVGSLQFAVGSWELAVGSWQLAVCWGPNAGCAADRPDLAVAATPSVTSCGQYFNARSVNLFLHGSSPPAPTPSYPPATAQPYSAKFADSFTNSSSLRSVYFLGYSPSYRG